MILSKDENRTVMKAPLGRGLISRALYGSEALEDEELRDWIVAFKKLGMEIRIVCSRARAQFEHLLRATSDCGNCSYSQVAAETRPTTLSACTPGVTCMGVRRSSSIP
jgi:hypothetical protein